MLEGIHHHKNCTYIISRQIDGTEERVILRVNRKGNCYIHTWNGQGTMAPYGSEFSRGVWISIFIFYFLTLSLRKFTVFYRIVFMYVYLILLRNTASRSNWKRVAGVITQWFWCKYFAHSFILHSECSKKNYRLPILDYNMAAYPHQVPGAACLCLEEKKEFCLFCHTLSPSDLFSA